MSVQAFRSRGATVKLGATATSSQATLSTARDVGDGQYDTVRVYNASTAIAFVEFGANPTAVSTGASIPLAPSSIETFQISGASLKAAVILASGTGDVYFTMGNAG